MRYLFAIVFAILFVVPLQATPIQYNISFIGESGSIAPTAGSFTYDADSHIFTDFHVTWLGGDYNLTESANLPQSQGAAPCLNGQTGPAATFELLSGSCFVEGRSTRWRGLGDLHKDFDLIEFAFFTCCDDSNIGDIGIHGFHGVPPHPAPSEYGYGSWTIAEVPETSSLALLPLGLIGLGFIRRRIQVK